MSRITLVLEQLDATLAVIADDGFAFELVFAGNAAARDAGRGTPRSRRHAARGRPVAVQYA
jgi:hypothetical protein